MLSPISDIQTKLPSTSVYGFLNKYSKSNSLPTKVGLQKTKQIKLSKTPPERKTAVVLTNTSQTNMNNSQVKNNESSNSKKKLFFNFNCKLIIRKLFAKRN